MGLVQLLDEYVRTLKIFFSHGLHQFNRLFLITLLIIIIIALRNVTDISIDKFNGRVIWINLISLIKIDELPLTVVHNRRPLVNHVGILSKHGRLAKLGLVRLAPELRSHAVFPPLSSLLPVRQLILIGRLLITHVLLLTKRSTSPNILRELRFISLRRCSLRLFQAVLLEQHRSQRLLLLLLLICYAYLRRIKCIVPRVLIGSLCILETWRFWGLALLWNYFH